jgi:hypothetical protein
MAKIPSVGGGGAVGGSGWVKIVDVAVPDGVVTDKVYRDTPNDTILETCTVTGLAIEVEVASAFPEINVGGVDAVLSQSADGGHYTGVVPVTIAGAGTVVAQSVTPETDTGAFDKVILAYVPPPEILTLSFTGGYPGGQTELKAGDTFQMQGTTDKNADAVQIQDFGAMVQSLETFASGTSFTVTGTIADRGVTPQALSAQVRARDAVTGALGPAVDTNAGAGGVDGTDVVTLNDLYPTVTWGSVTYPGAQQALKGAESATVGVTLADLDTVLFDDDGSGELTVTNPTTIEATKTVTRAGGTYNISTSNLRAAANRTANGATTTQTTTVSVVNVAPTIDITLPAARLRSGGNHGTSAQDYAVTITADQELLSAPSLLADAGGNRGTFQGVGFTGGPSVWTRDIRIDETVPDEKGTFSFSGLAATGLSGLVQTTINSGTNYTLGGFVPRDVTFDPFTPISNETVDVTAESRLTADRFSNGNTSVRQFFGTPNTIDTGKEGWWSLTSNFGLAQIRMLHTPTVAANSGTLTLYDLEELV